MNQKQKRKQKIRWSEYSGAVAFVLLCIGCVTYTVPRIENDLRLRANQELGMFPWASIEVSGRTVYLNGSIQARGDQGWALKRLQGIEGVREVVDRTEMNRTGAL